jgi:hypothetical protein
MNKSILSLACAILAAAAATPALATSTVTYVSVKGNDNNNTNNCANPASPCRTFARAVSQTTAGGEVLTLTAGDFGAFGIDRPISITGVPGAGVFSSNRPDGEQIDITIGLSDTVYLTGLTLDGSSGSTVAIFVNQGGAIVVRDCLMRGNKSGGLINHAGARIFFEDVAVSGGLNGVYLEGATAPALFHRYSATLDTQGISAPPDGTVISEGSFTKNFEAGIGNPFSASIFVNRTSVTGSGIGLWGAANSGGNNLFKGNTTDVDGSLTAIGLK